LAYFYQHPETKLYGFGFNTADGGGFLPEYDLAPFTEIHEVNIQVDQMPIYGCSINDLLTIISDFTGEALGGLNNEIFELTPAEFNHFVNTPLRLKANPRDIPVEQMKQIVIDRFEHWKTLSGKGNYTGGN